MTTCALLARAAAAAPVVTAVVHPVDAVSPLAAVDAAKAGFIVPVLIGPAARIQSLAAAEAVDISGYRMVDAANPAAAAGQAVAMARAGEVATLMKGNLHTDVLTHPVMSSQTGLRTATQISYVFVLDVPDYPRLLLLKDMAINIAPVLAEKVGIVQNAIDCAHVIRIARPRVAILAALAVVNPRSQATVDAAPLRKMADRGEITGAMLDGPLAFDNAVSAAAAAEKGIVSDVAGQADILVVRPLIWQHACQGADLPRRRRSGWRGAGRGGAEHPDQPGGQCRDPASVLRIGRAGRAGRAIQQLGRDRGRCHTTDGRRS